MSQCALSIRAVAPTLRGINPSVGPKEGGASLTITGSGFRRSTGLKVSFVFSPLEHLSDPQRVLALRRTEVPDDDLALNEFYLYTTGDFFYQASET